jgi:hypothetical protein
MVDAGWLIVFAGVVVGGGAVVVTVDFVPVEKVDVATCGFGIMAVLVV